MSDDKKPEQKKRKRPNPKDSHHLSSVQKVYASVKEDYPKKKISMKTETANLLSNVAITLQKMISREGFKAFGDKKKTLTPKQVDSILKSTLGELFGEDFSVDDAIKFSDDAVAKYSLYIKSKN